MVLWSIVLIFLGIAAFLDSFYNYGEIFRRVNSTLFLLVSLGLLVRVSQLRKEAKKAELQKKNEQEEKEKVEFQSKEKVAVR